MVDIIQVSKDDSTKSNVKRALLAARKKDRIELPFRENARVGEMYHISQFFKHPMGVEAMLNINALENYVLIDVNTYRCLLFLSSFLLLSCLFIVAFSWVIYHS